MLRLLPIALLSTACANVLSIEDSAQVGSATVIKDWFTSAAVVQTSEGPVMIDAGYREGRMGRALEDLGVDGGEVVAVLLTHGHSDHQGAIALFPNAEVISAKLEVGLVEVEGDASVDRTVDEDGATLTFGDTSIEAFFVPGHTAGSTVYLVDGALFLGDTCLINRDRILEPVAERRSEDPEEAVASLVDLALRLEPRADEIDWLVPSHSGALASMDALLDFAERSQD